MRTITITLLAFTAGLSACGDYADGKRDTTAAGAVAGAAAVAPSTTQPPVSAADFQISLVTIESQCFDSAGALVTFQPDLAIDGGGDAYKGAATIVYEVSSGGQVDTFSVETADGRYDDSRHVISTPTCGPLSARIVRVIEQ